MDIFSQLYYLLAHSLNSFADEIRTLHGVLLQFPSLDPQRSQPLSQAVMKIPPIEVRVPLAGRDG